MTLSIHISPEVWQQSLVATGQSPRTVCVFVGAQLNEELLYLVRDPGTRVDSLTGILPVKRFRTL